MSPSAGARVWIVPGVLTLALVGMHALPGRDLAGEDWWMVWHVDKWLHALVFSLWSLSVCISLAKQRILQGRRRLELVVLSAALIFGTVLEAGQGAWMPGRTMDGMDVLADVAGTWLSFSWFRFIFGTRPGRIASD